MKTHIFNTTLALILTLALVTPMAFFTAPHKARAVSLDGEFTLLYNNAYDSVLNSGGTVEAAKAAGTAATGETATNSVTGAAASCTGVLASIVASVAGTAAVNTNTELIINL